jgi:hypothetical protein
VCECAGGDGEGLFTHTDLRDILSKQTRANLRFTTDFKNFEAVINE